MVTLGLSLPPVGSVRESIAVAREAERVGIDEVWQTEVMGRDAMVALGAYALSTDRVTLGIGITNVWTRIPAALAAAAATLNELAPGRIVLGLGPWHEPLASQAGVSLAPAIAAMRDATYIVRRLLGGERVTYAGEVFSASDLGLALPPAPVPIVFGVNRPRLVALAGEIADGVLLNFDVPASRFAETIGWLRDGAARTDRDPGELTVRALRFAGIGDRGELQSRMRERNADADPDELAAVGSADDVARAVARFLATGVDGIVLTAMRGTDPVETVAAALRARPA